MFRLFKRDLSGAVTHYYEVWVELDNRRLVQHWGALGEQGQAEPHRLKLLRSLEDQVDDLLASARAEGFERVETSAYHTLVISYDEAGFGPLDDTDKQHALGERLDEILGWTGLGWCLGCDVIEGHLSASCLVLDVELGRAVVEDGLSGSEFAAIKQITAE